MSNLCYLSTLTYDPDGFLELDLDEQSTGLSEFHRRATIVETLDNSVFLDSMGTVDAGRKLTVVVRCSDEDAAILETLCRVYDVLRLAFHGGTFLVTALGGNRQHDATSLQLTLLEKVSA